MTDPLRPDGQRPGIPLQEQFLILMSACFALVIILTGIAGDGTAEFKVVPEVIHTLTIATGIVLVGFGLYHGVKALLSRRSAMSTRVYVVPFLGLLVWASPFLVEAAFQ